jgi:hypothetical protein
MLAVKKMVYLDPAQERLLKRLAAEEHISETEVMRRALSVYARDRLRDPLAELIGTFRAGPVDGAIEHDRYLLEGPQGPRGG